MNKKLKTYSIHLGLFLLTLVTTTVAGAEWQHGRYLLTGGLSKEMILDGLYFSIPFITIFTFHEFGHYFTAVHNKVKTSLPYFIPVPFLPGFIGTLGAVIRLKERVKSTQANFDIGIAGPLAGFVVAVGVLFYGYTNLPEPDYVYEIHPSYKYFGEDYGQYVYDTDTVVTKEMVKPYVTEEEYAELPDTVLAPIYGPNLSVNKSFAIKFFESYVVSEEDQHKIPNIYEYAHYPFLFAGYLALFFTALNLLPVGQLDGGHVIYGLFGFKGHRIIALSTFFTLLLLGGIGVVHPGMPFEELLFYVPLYIWFLYACMKSTGFSKRNRWLAATIIFTVQYFIFWFWPDVVGFNGWLLFGFLLGRVIGVQHPPALDEGNLSPGRVVLGWISLAILVISFTPYPLG